MEIKASSLETPTPVQVWQLPRRFDAVTWFVRLQRENPDFLNHIRVSIPQTGPSLLQVQDGTKLVQSQLGPTGETLLGSGIFPWHGHSAYLENLGHWSERHAPEWLASAAITWVLCLHRDAWLAIAGAWLPKEDTTWLVKSAWLTLALGSADSDLLALVPDDAYDNMHAPVYSDETARALRWLQASHPSEQRTWLETLAKRSFFKNIWSRLPIEHRMRWEEQYADLFTD